jgi:hypothetical protein
VNNDEFIPHEVIENGDTVYQVFAGRKMTSAQVSQAIHDQLVRRENRTERQGKRLITRVSIFIDDEWLNACE